MHSSPPERAPKSQLAVEQPSTGGCWNLPKKDSPCPKTKKNLQGDGRRGTITIKSNPIPAGLVTHKLVVVQLFSHVQLFVTPWTQGGMPGLPVPHHLLELAQTHVHWVSDAIQPSHCLSSPSPPAFNLADHQSLFQ